MRNMAAAVRPEGILVIACPNPLSFKGLGAHLTPHWFHVWFYKHVLGIKEAGTDDCGPFPTVMSSRIAPEPMCALAESCGLTVELRTVSRGGGWYGKQSPAQRVIEWGLDVACGSAASAHLRQVQRRAGRDSPGISEAGALGPDVPAPFGRLDRGPGVAEQVHIL